MNGFLGQLSKIGPARLIVMFGVAAGVAGTLMAVAMGVGSPDRALLYSGLDMNEASEIAAQLDQAGIRYEFSAGNTSILVDAERVADARMMLSAEGLPSTGSVGYEIFDDQDGFGSTQFVQNVNRVRALEGELARTIQALDGVASARVHLAIPERRLFDRDSEAPKASVWVELRQDDLGARHARSIRNLVAGAVPGLQTSAVTILDAEGRLLARAEESGGQAGASLDIEERRSEIEDRLRRQLTDLVETMVGRGGVQVQVTADVNFDRITESSELFDPQGQVVRSSTTVEENTNESDRDLSGGAVSASAGIPDGASGEDPEATSQAASTRTEEIINYEVSRTTRTEVREAGDLQRLSVAVAVDGTSSLDAEGGVVWEPRSEDELERIEALVKSAIGFDETRGDAVEVANVRFARQPIPADATAPPSSFQFDKGDIMRGAELFVLLVVAVLIIFLVARPLLKSLPADAGPGALALAAPGGMASVDGASSARLADGRAVEEGGVEGVGQRTQQSLPAPGDDRFNVAQIDGQVRASSVKKMAEIVETHPDESVSILRTWLHGA